MQMPVKATWEYYCLSSKTIKAGGQSCTGFVRGITKSYKVLYLFLKNKTSYKVLYFIEGLMFF